MNGRAAKPVRIYVATLPSAKLDRDGALRLLEEQLGRVVTAITPDWELPPAVVSAAAEVATDLHSLLRGLVDNPQAQRFLLERPEREAEDGDAVLRWLDLADAVAAS